jgi:hypothetical protein
MKALGCSRPGWNLSIPVPGWELSLPRGGTGEVPSGPVVDHHGVVREERSLAVGAPRPRERANIQRREVRREPRFGDGSLASQDLHRGSEKIPYPSPGRRVVQSALEHAPREEDPLPDFAGDPQEDRILCVSGDQAAVDDLGLQPELCQQGLDQGQDGRGIRGGTSQAVCWVRSRPIGSVSHVSRTYDRGAGSARPPSNSAPPSGPDCPAGAARAHHATAPFARTPVCDGGGSGSATQDRTSPLGIGRRARFLLSALVAVGGARCALHLRPAEIARDPPRQADQRANLAPPGAGSSSGDGRVAQRSPRDPRAPRFLAPREREDISPGPWHGHCKNCEIGLRSVRVFEWAEALEGSSAANGSRARRSVARSACLLPASWCPVALPEGRLGTRSGSDVPAHLAAILSRRRHCGGGSGGVGIRRNGLPVAVPLLLSMRGAAWSSGSGMTRPVTRPMQEGVRTHAREGDHQTGAARQA